MQRNDLPPKDETTGLSEQFKYIGSGLDSYEANISEITDQGKPSRAESDPVSFYLLSDGGLKIHSVRFCEESEVDEHLVAGFLMAIQNFTAQVFAESVDRIQLENVCILVKFLPPLTVVYVFKGSACSASENLDRLLEKLQKSPDDWNAILMSILTGKVISKDVETSVTKIVSDVFVKI